MHQVYYVLIPKEEAENESEAMDKAQQELDSNSFVGEGGYFANNKCDWYVVGGRWADLLVERHDWAKQAKAEIDQMLSENPDAKGEKIGLRGCHYGSSDTEKLQKILNEKAELIWGRHRPSDYPKVLFNRWSKLGSNPQIPDCAELTSPELLKYLQEYASEVEVFDPNEYQELPISEYKPEEFNGDHYLVVIDYHN